MTPHPNPPHGGGGKVLEKAHPRPRVLRRKDTRAKLGLVLSRRLGLALAAAASIACATVNYLDPTGPSYETRFAEAARSPPPPGSPLRVVTFNIAFAVKIDLALEVLQQSPPLRGLDVLVLQEMDAPSVERIARTLQMNSLYVPSAVHPKSGRDFGCAILSPWPLVEPGKVVLPFAAVGSRVRRSAARATILRGGERTRVYSVHLPSPLGVTSYARREQLKVILADAAGSPDPVVIAGDFNSNDLGERFVDAGYEWITRDVATTTRFLFFGLSFDHVFARGLVAAPGVDSFGVVGDNRGASDHRPVWAVLARPHAAVRGESP
jgi:endonuclease/exonuclease/phosphatase family metal-dependent hydrolase